MTPLITVLAVVTATLMLITKIVELKLVIHKHKTETATPTAHSALTQTTSAWLPKAQWATGVLTLVGLSVSIIFGPTTPVTTRDSAFIALMAVCAWINLKN